ncbi:glutamic acid-rich protein [Tanacetum coccineum]
MESLHLSFSRAVEAGIFKGYKIDPSTTLSHLFYVDNAILLLYSLEWSCFLSASFQFDMELSNITEVNPLKSKGVDLISHCRDSCWKSKSLIKPTRTRIEALRRRAEAKQRFLKEDLAKLLANGLDLNAYGRTEEFIAGLNLLACYTFIDQSCEYILKQLSVMQKLGQCPEECRETVASLMHAAARFSDLPELRDLRDVFQDRHGNGLECYVNQVFVEKLASKPPVVEKRIKLLQDIASEFSIQWDSKAFKQRMDKPSRPAQNQGSILAPLSVNDDKYKHANGNNVFRKNDRFPRKNIACSTRVGGPCEKTIRKEPVLHHDGNGNGNYGRKEVLDIPFVKREEKRPKDRLQHAHDEQVLHHDGNGNGNYRRKEVLDVPSVEREERRSKERKKYAHEGPMLHNGGNVPIRREDVLDIPVAKREEKRPKERLEDSHKGQVLHHDGNGIVKRKEVLDIPFVGRQEKYVYKHEGLTDKAENGGFGKNDTPLKMKEAFDDDRVNRGRNERHGYKQEAETIDTRYDDDHIYRRHEKRSARSSHDRRPESNELTVNGKAEEEEAVRSKSYYNSSLPPPYVKSNIPPPYSKPSSHRSKHTSLDSIDTIAGSSPQLKGNVLINTDHDVREDRHYQNDIPLPKPRSMRRKHSKSSSSHDDVGSSEDARIVKRTSSSRRKERKGLQILFDDDHYHSQRDDEEKMMDKLLLHYSKKPSAYDLAARFAALRGRSLSLPNDQSGESEPKKVYARANSFQPDNQAKHVHPKLPDYDDLAARFAALRGR